MTHGSIEWSVRAFDELGPADVHDVLRLRQDVFIVEQNCAFREIDGRDPHATHLLGRVDGRLVAYARVFAPNETAPETGIGRVVTHASVRGSGVGRALMGEALRVAARIGPGAAVRVAAQVHLEAFYNSLGFEPAGEPYLEDDIPHLDMVRPAESAPV